MLLSASNVTDVFSPSLTAKVGNSGKLQDGAQQIDNINNAKVN